MMGYGGGRKGKKGGSLAGGKKRVYDGRRGAKDDSL